MFTYVAFEVNTDAQGSCEPTIMALWDRIVEVQPDLSPLKHMIFFKQHTIGRPTIFNSDDLNSYIAHSHQKLDFKRLYVSCIPSRRLRVACWGSKHSRTFTGPHSAIRLDLTCLSSAFCRVVAYDLNLSLQTFDSRGRA